MGWGIIIILIIVGLIFPRVLITVLIYCLAGWLLCDIDTADHYTWYSGIWHGLFFVCNYLRHLIWDVPYKAVDYTTAYNVFYWIFSILSIPGFFLGGTGRRAY